MSTTQCSAWISGTEECVHWEQTGKQARGHQNTKGKKSILMGVGRWIPNRIKKDVWYCVCVWGGVCTSLGIGQITNAMTMRLGLPLSRKSVIDTDMETTARNLMLLDFNWKFRDKCMIW